MSPSTHPDVLADTLASTVIALLFPLQQRIRDKLRRALLCRPQTWLITLNRTFNIALITLYVQTLIYDGKDSLSYGRRNS